MTLLKKGKKAYRALERAAARALKFIIRLLTGQGELERALRKALAEGGGGLSANLVKTVARALARSSQLASIKQDIFGKKPFSPTTISCVIAEQKNIKDAAVISALHWCLQVLSAVNSVHQRIAELQREDYDPSNSAHVALLEALWDSLKPETRRTDWTALGFQNGSKPESDFRGMGMLGLHQLVYFAQRWNSEAAVVLAESCNPQRYFPFAAAGINVTAFTSTMLDERRLDGRLYEGIIRVMTDTGSAGASPDQELLDDAGLAVFNDFYRDEYVEFSRFWHASLPESTMAFPGIFGVVKQRSNSRFPPLTEDEL